MKIFLFLKPVLWLALICYGLFLPAEDLPVEPFLQIPHFDKMVHFTLFFIFALLLYKPFKKLKLKFMFWAPATAIFLGALLEIFQRQIAVSRSSELYDFVANAIGIFASILFYHFFVSGKKWEILF